MRHVILVSIDGKETGTAELLDAHRGGGTLHRAFSALLFSMDGKKVLLQKRTPEKLFGDLWANTCCSHPFPGEDTVAAGERRIQEELGISCKLTVAGSFVYRAPDPAKPDFSEHEHDTVLTGMIDETTLLSPDPTEVADTRWMEIEELRRDVKSNPARYAPWLRYVLDLVPAPVSA